MSTSIRFLGCSGFEIAGPARRVLVDPFLTQNPEAALSVEELAAPDLLLISHAAPDHSGDAAAIALRTGCPVVCGPDVRLLLLEAGVPEGQIRSTMWGIQVEVDGVRVRPVMNAHYSLATLADGTRVTGLPLSYIFALEPECPIYFSGDTAFFDMTAIGRMYRPRVALIGCALPHQLLPLAPGAGEIVSGETDPDEAAEIAEMLGVDVAVGHHYLTLDEQGEQFVQAVRARDSTGARQAFALEPTDVLTIEGDAVRVVQGGHA